MKVSVSSHDPDGFEWLWNGPRRGLLNPNTTVCDAGVVPVSFPATQTNVVVLRGPCSSALRELAHRSDSIDHLVLLREPWRPLRRQDAEDALGIGIVAEVQFSPRVARLGDAGLLSARIASLSEFAELKAWAEGRFLVSQPKAPPEVGGACRRNTGLRRPPS